MQPVASSTIGNGFAMTKCLSLFILICGFACWGTAQYDDPALQVEVSFSHESSNAKTVVEKLSKQVGVPLWTASQTGAEMLCISVKNVKLSDLLQKVAQVTSGEWRAEDGGFRLIRPVGLVNAQAAERLKMRRAAVSEAIRKKVEAVYAKPKPGAASAVPDLSGMNPFGGSAPTEKAIVRLLQMSNTSLLAQLEDGERIVYSSQANRMQNQINGNVATIVQELITSHNQAIRNQPVEVGGDSDIDIEQVRAFLKELGIGADDRPIDSRPAKLLLVASRGGGMMGMSFLMGESIGLELLLFDATGKVIFRGQSSLQLGSGLAGIFGAAMEEALATVGGQAPQQKEPPKVDGPDGEVEFSARTKEVLGIFGNASGPMGPRLPTNISKESESLLLRPDINDPLSFEQTDVLFAIAKVKGWQVVANLPDSRISFLGQMMGGGPKSKVNEAILSFREDANVKAIESSGWYLVMPADPIEARIQRVDRPSLAVLLAAAKSKGVPGLDDCAAYAIRNESPMRTPAAMLYLALYAPNLMSQGMMGMTDWNVLRLYAQLDPGNKMRLQSGERIEFSVLDPAKRSLTERILFGTSANLTVGPPSNVDENFFLAMMKQFIGRQAQDWKQEPTEIMPGGLPNAGVLSMKLTSSPIGTVTGDNPMAGMMGALGPGELALLQLFKEDPNMGQMMGMMPPIQGLKLGTRKSYRFTFQIASDVYATKTLQDDFVDRNATDVSLDSLPADFKAAIAKQMEEIRNSPIFKLMIGIGTRQGVPPPGS